MTQTGYEGPQKDTESKKIPPPESREWKLYVEHIGQTEDVEDLSVFVRLEVDGEPLGLLTMPDNEHLRFLRERLGE